MSDTKKEKKPKRRIMRLRRKKSKKSKLNVVDASAKKQMKEPKKKRDKKQKRKTVRTKHQRELPLLNVLLLGVGSSGKSTVAKQMRVIHRPYTKVERNKFGMILKQNLLDAIQLFLKAYHLEETHGVDVVLQKYQLSANVSREIVRMWKKDAIQKIWTQAHGSGQFASTTEYVLQHVERIMQPDFEPTDADIVHAQIKTTGISEYLFEADYSSMPVQFNFIDTGGEQNQRRKWATFMRQSTAVVFVAALDVYDEMNVIDFTANAMQDSMETFWELSKIPELKNKQFTLFLNKRDKFEAKLSRSPLKNLFPEYDGGADANKAVEYITEQFRKGFEGDELNIFDGCALDSEGCKATFSKICARAADRYSYTHPQVGGY
mmetsp:Transcript_6546/g.7111  ORF Transcript_6546/g.7111 Transcript_6546/m.7111 type:complete len:376 (+) Transcript_6546:1577-2704(+)|eukprot:CAMPEP_0168517430 /NCGR_PEP_ID=MMETSP0405-20121227/6032_1 /TAXON_ID=498012 /ORGANISM="Trichosphaerium sp, Strain Am-I-7 wt" /LENGTH=375 /DNA_ID=CAMNT_0008537409 /DNA_START=1665 /DNA_END=2792 /DNA_ORIENTATION=-